MIVIGLTGSIGMGKSTVANMFRRFGVPVFDADAEVHRMQGHGGSLVAAIEQAFPGTTGPAGVDRQALGKKVLDDREELKKLEALVHPAVAKSRQRFLRKHRFRPLVVVDVPLLFETGGEDSVDVVVVVSAPEHVQRARVLGRPGMTQARLDAILRHQLADAEKRRRADFVIPTGTNKARTAMMVRKLIAALSDRSGR